MTQITPSFASTAPRDLAAGLVVFLVALPLCLGIAVASDAPPFAGLLSGIVGGVMVGLLSGSHTSVSGPAAGLTAVVAAQIALLGSFQAFLLAVVLAGLIQIALGAARAGSLASFFPTSVIKGLLAAIGVILILKQIPHVVGHDPDPEGDMAFYQPDHGTTLSGLLHLASHFHPGAAAVGVASLALLIAWDRCRSLKRSPVPAPLVVVALGVGLSLAFGRLGGSWAIHASHLVQVPVAESLGGFVGFLQLPDFAQWRNPAVYRAALTIAAVTTLETLLNLEAVDRLDPRQRTSPPSRELVAQGVGNVLVGLIGGLPMTSVVIRSSVNINAGGRTKLAAVVHGLLLLFCVAALPAWLNRVPLACLAAILLVTGLKLVSPELVRRMWTEGRPQFIPFAATVVAIVVTDLLVGVLIGLAVSIGFILRSNMRRPLRRVIEKHLGGEVVHIDLANQVSFLNRAVLSRVLNEVPPGGHVLLDARDTDYFDPDVLDLIRDFAAQTGPARGVNVSLLGFQERYQLGDQIQYVDYSTREIQAQLTPGQVLQVLKDGHERFRTGRRLTRDLGRQVVATANGQHPLAVVLSCIDSRTPAELIFDLGMGDIFSVRIAGNVASRKVLGSIEYACAIAGARLVVVMGHTRCGAVTTVVDLALGNPNRIADSTAGCEHLGHVLREIRESMMPLPCRQDGTVPEPERARLIDTAARGNVSHVVRTMLWQSQTLHRLVRHGQVGVVGAIYDVATGDLAFLEPVEPAGCANPEVANVPVPA